MKNKKNLLNSIILILLLVAIDQIIKVFMININIPLIPNLVNLKYAENVGVAFGTRYKFSLIIVSISILLVLIGVLMYIYRKIPKLFYTLTVIFAGGLGNLLDRCVRGYVIDYINVKHFPVFNIADIYVTIGVVIFFINYIIIFAKKQKNQPLG